MLVETIHLENDLQVFGTRVTNFPQGISEAFDKLVKLVGDFDRSYYGICQWRDGGFEYRAAALQKEEGEAEKYNLEHGLIEKGKYLAINLKDWRKSTATIKDIFCELMLNECLDKESPSIEWYVDESDMYCMVKVDIRKELQQELTAVTDELLQIISLVKDEQVNAIPFEGSWTVAQVAAHLIKSNEGFAQIIQGPAKETHRPSDALVTTIKSEFLDFNKKMQSPDFVLPEIIAYNKEELYASLQNIMKSIKQALSTADLELLCLAFEIPVYGYLSRLEAFNFVICHIQRHIHQLKNIINVLDKNHLQEHQ